MAKKASTKKKVEKKARKAPAKKATVKKSGIGITPLHDKVIVKPIEPETVTAGGIIIPDTVDKEKPEQGTVVAVGPGKFDDGVREPMTVKEGDRVIFSKYGYDELKFKGEEYYILSEGTILAILN